MQGRIFEVNRAHWPGWLCRMLVLWALIEAPFGASGQSTVWAWGYNSDGQLGDGTTIELDTPVALSGPLNVIDVIASNPILALRSDGTVWSYGNASVLPGPVNAVAAAVAIARGKSSLALRSDGTVWAWSDGADPPGPVSGLTDVVAIAASYYNSLALRSDGTVWAWSGGADPPGPVSGLTDVVAISAGGSHDLALRSDGTVWAWGVNAYGQLGDGSTTDRYSPGPVSGLTNVLAISSGYEHNLAVRSDGTVWAWGRNDFRQLGSGTSFYSTLPVPNTDVADVIAVAAGFTHNLVVKSDGTAWAWGDGYFGDLGGAGAYGSGSVQVSGLTSVVAVAAGGYFSVALQSPLVTGHTVAFAKDATAYPGQTVDLVASLWADGARLSDKPITFTAGTTTLGTGTTDTYGIARLRYAIPAGTPSGSYALIASFAGDAAYRPIDRPLTLTIAKRMAPTISYTNPATGYPGQTVELAASLWSNGARLAHKTIAFREGTTILGIAATDVKGIARLNYRIPDGTVPGVHTLTALFDGDIDDDASSSDLRLTVAKRPSIAYTNAAHGYPGRTIVLVASLWSNGGRLSGKTIIFREGENALGTATTDARGIARLTYTLATDALVGEHTLTAAFVGDADYLPARRDLPLSVAAVGTPMPTLTFTNTASCAAGQSATLVASVWSDGIPLGGKTITFMEGTTTLGSAITNAEGVLRWNYMIPAGTPSGSHAVTASYAGDADYLPSRRDLVLIVD